MNARAKRVLADALELPVEDRTEVAQQLLDSLDHDAPAEIEEAWAPLIARRAQEVLDGAAPTRDLDEALDEVEARARASAR